MLAAQARQMCALFHIVATDRRCIQTNGAPVSLVAPRTNGKDA
jgi:hypothetical protein